MIDPSIVNDDPSVAAGVKKLAVKAAAKKGGIWISDDDPNLADKLVQLKGFSPEAAAKVVAAAKAKAVMLAGK